ncbi:hybrid signal transduction histidine kinase M [Contarinia nasturtii]|uniref:hybrid signal transduction histidine kinase M n=1 Tax=Contarinia nasturtii TaxID=265458 RepID=UPI0012D43AFB|nr:hybrid signal transduction histidine kinase M [Contarinia nasturtii]
MKTTEMSDANNRNKTRTPNIFKNVDRPLPSPTSGSMKLNESAPLSPTLSPNTKSMISQKVQTLKQRKQDLDKLLQEKNNLLQQLCREEAKIIGCSTFSLNDLSSISGIDCSDGGVNNCDRAQLNNNSTLRRHIDTGFKLPENLLNSNEDDINQLLLSKKIQQQISQASLKLANDATQTKSIRRAHRQNYEVAQQKIQSINQTLSFIRSRANAESINSRDDINLNNNLGYATINNVINGSKNHRNDIKSKQHLNVSSISLENNNIMSERRNSAVSTGSASQYLAANALKSRPRCDSYGGQTSNVQNYATATTTKSDKMLHSPTYAYQQQVQIPHLHYKSHADKIAYVTNAVANAAPNANPNANNNGNAMASPKYGRLKPLTVDTGSINESYYYPPSGSANHQHRSHFQQHYTQHQHQHRHSPYTTSRAHLTPTKVKHTPSQHLHINTKPPISDDEEDDIAGQYATLLTLSDQLKPGSVHQDIENQDTDTHYTEILCRKPSAPLPLTERNQFQTKDVNVVTKSQGLGGYWTTNENNERVWLSVDNRYSSLDRKSQKNKMKKQQVARTVNQPTKSTSLSNFNFINKSDDTHDSDAASTMNAAQIDQRRPKPKQWTETSLDTPIRKVEQMSPKLVSPPIYYRDKNRLSSHSLHSPSRNAISIGNSHTLTSLQTPQILSDLSKALSTSANALTGVESVMRSQSQQPLPSPSQSYHHSTSIQSAPLFDHTNSNANPNMTSIVSTKLQSPDVPSTTNSFIDNSSNCFTPNISSAEIQVESPKNVTIVQPAKFQPYKEVTKPFEMSDFYKYSTKFRQKTASANIMQSENSSPQLPPKNIMHQMKNAHRHMHSVSLSANVAEPTSPVYPSPINQ